MKKNKQHINKGSGKTIVIIILALVIFVSILVAVVFIQTQKNKVVFVPAVTYDQVAEKRLVAMLQNHPSLSESDQVAKVTLSHIENPIHQTYQYTMKYDPQMEEVVVEILSSNVDAAKENAIMWLKSQGLSDQGICTLPVEFILNDKAAEFLRGKNMVISPLAPGC
jgi:hypothetical protein